LIQYFKSKPNFITTKKIKGNIIKLDKKHIQNTSLKNKIILIENADPGFDWIFTQNPLGLITKYGGVASHMSIRCAEQGLPAAIGCGEMIFEQLTSSSKILLDCNSNEILILENQKTTEEIEVKKVLKSLGYIK
jgi:phosphoenolpyruvate-protein kinase (PTS system EI component)